MIQVKKIKPLFTALITTMDVYEEDVKTGNLIDTSRQKGALKEYQTVVAVGDTVRGVNVGDLVCINPARYAVKKYQEGSMKDGIISENQVIKYNFNIVEMDNVNYLLLDNSDIRYVITEYTEVKEYKSDLILPDNKIIV